jgi:hypothetical protein
MNSLIAVTLWITLVTVVPGLITIATLFGAGAVVDPALVSRVEVQASEWIWLSVAVAVMVLTQAVGIVLERWLVDGGHLGSEKIEWSEKRLQPPPLFEESMTINPYHEYERLYYLLVRLTGTDDAYGHLERSIAQFFLTINTLVSFSIGIVATALVVAVSVLVRGPTTGVFVRGGLYLGVLALALVVSHAVAVARFEVMAKSTWSLRTRPERRTADAASPSRPSTTEAEPRPR